MAASRGANSAEVYGFVGYLASTLAYVMYIIWAFVPESALDACGLTYYPSKEWAIIIPTWLCALVVFGFWAYESLNMMSVPPRTSLTTVQDRRSKFQEPRSYFPGLPGCVPDLVDVPAPVISELLFKQMPRQSAADS